MPDPCPSCPPETPGLSTNGEPCPTCEGYGEIPPPPPAKRRAPRSVAAAPAEAPPAPVAAPEPPPVAFLFDRKRLVELTERLGSMADAAAEMGIDPALVRATMARVEDFRVEIFSAIDVAEKRRREAAASPPAPVFVDIPSGCAYVEASTGQPCTLPMGHGGRHVPRVVSPGPQGAPAKVEWADVKRASADAQEPPSKGKAGPSEKSADPWVRFRDEAERIHGPGLYGLLLHQDDLLAAKRMHPMSPWWRETFRRFFEYRLSVPTLQWILALCGRGSGKSTTLERLAIAVSLFAPRSMPPSEAWTWPFISILKEDAKKRIHEIAKLMNLAYGLELKPNSNLEIHTLDSWGNEIEFLSMASTIGAVSGPSTMGCTVDEAAKLRSTGANPDVELIVSLAETSRARENWIGVRCSSAWETRGAHQAAIDRGSNIVNFVATIGVQWIDLAIGGFHEVAAWEAAQGNQKGAAQIRAFARTLTAHSPNVPTWVCNPTIPALRSRFLIETVARDPEDEELDNTTFWLRECGSMPLARDGGAWVQGQLDGLADANAGLASFLRGGAPPAVTPDGSMAPMKVRGARPGDARYAGPDPIESPLIVPFQGWDKGTVF